MPLIPPLATNDAGDARDSLEALQQRLGRVPNMYRTFAHAPRILDAAAVAMAKAIRVDLDPKLRELAYLKVTHMTDCHVCWHYHEPAGKQAGLIDEQVRILGRFEESAAYSELEKDVLRFTEQWTQPVAWRRACSPGSRPLCPPLTSSCSRRLFPKELHDPFQQRVRCRAALRDDCLSCSSATAFDSRERQ